MDIDNDYARRGELVNKMFEAGLSADEQRELDAIEKRIEDHEAPAVDAMLAPLEALAEKQEAFAREVSGVVDLSQALIDTNTKLMRLRDAGTAYETAYRDHLFAMGRWGSQKNRISALVFEIEADKTKATLTIAREALFAALKESA